MLRLGSTGGDGLGILSAMGMRGSRRPAGARRGIGLGFGPRAGLTRLLLFAVVLRALAPLGFMPSLDEGRFEIVICTGFGFKTIQVDAAGRPLASDEPAEDADAPSGECAFRSAAQIADLPSVAALSAPSRPALEQVYPPPRQALPPPAQGPPLGARAPPSTIG